MKTIELLLIENVDNLGIVGDVVRVRPGYARNYLLPHGLADTPSAEKIAQLAERRAQVEKQMAELKAANEALIEKIDGFELTMERSCNDQGILYGGVSQHEIAEALQAEGFAVEDRYVRIGEQIKRLDTYPIPIVIDKELKAEIKLWVVSDRPLETDEDEADEDEAETEADEVADASPADSASDAAEPEPAADKA